jgi:hypothetical protein
LICQIFIHHIIAFIQKYSIFNQLTNRILNKIYKRIGATLYILYWRNAYIWVLAETLGELKKK